MNTKTTTAPTFSNDEALWFRARDAFEELRTELSQNQNLTTRPSELPIDHIFERTELLQPRELDERHIQELRRAIKQQGFLEALTVIQVGTKAILIDGHHRRAAYKDAGIKTPVPVQYFSGTLEEAVLEAGRANSKAKLPMLSAERQNYAWRLVLLEIYSKKQIREATGVSDGQVANMRRVMNGLGEEACTYDAWLKALNTFNGREREPLSDEAMEQWIETQANEYADRMSQEFGKKLRSNTTITARALGSGLIN